jgi:hypothetical protein
MCADTPFRLPPDRVYRAQVQAVEAELSIRIAVLVLQELIGSGDPDMLVEAVDTPVELTRFGGHPR